MRSDFVRVAIACGLLPADKSLDAMLWGHPNPSVISAMPDAHAMAVKISSKTTMDRDSEDTRSFASAFGLSLSSVSYILKKGA